jgi:hypothetical protein
VTIPPSIPGEDTSRSWVASDDDSPTTPRAKLVGTYVVRRGAPPLGSGPITYPTYFVAGFSVVFPHVARIDPASSQRGPDAPT